MRSSSWPHHHHLFMVKTMHEIRHVVGIVITQKIGARSPICAGRPRVSQGGAPNGWEYVIIISRMAHNHHKQSPLRSACGASSRRPAMRSIMMLVSKFGARQWPHMRSIHGIGPVSPEFRGVSQSPIPLT